VPAKSSASALGYTLTMIADITLLLIILAGLLLLRRLNPGTSGLTRVLWKQVRQFSLSQTVIRLNCQFSSSLKGDHLARYCLRC
jgi:hypothetical protein